jgi:hypothetical protein
MKLSVLRRILAAAVCAALAAGFAGAQESRGSITGSVTDASGAIVPGAAVVATNQATNLAVTAKSDARGNYSLLYLPAGSYTVTVELTGFKKIGRTVEVRVGDRMTLNLRLEPGSLTEQVEVVAGTPLLDMSSGSAGQVIDAKRIALLPLSDGNPFVLARLTPGAAYTGDLKFSRPFDNAGTASITADGATGGNEFTLDGMTNNAHGRRIAYVPPSDAVEEFKVETATYDAQQGHTAGATVSVSMKSGTNALHGTAYYFYRDEKLSANDLFLNRANKPRAPLSYNRWGGTLGGPVVTPGYSGKDKTFFMVAYERLDDEFPEPGTWTVPTEAMRRGDFSGLLSQGIVIYDPLTAVKRADGRIERKPFPGNIIPANRITPIAQNYMQYWPLPNQAADAQGRNNYVGPNPRSDDFWNLSTRIDHRFSARNRGFLRFSYNDRREARGNWTGEVGGIRPIGNYLFRTNYNSIYDHVYTHSNTTVLNVKMGFSRFEEPNIRQHQGEFDPKTLGFPPTTAAYFGDASYFPNFAVNQMDSLGQNMGDAQYTTVYSLQPTLTRMMGSHSVRLGYDGRLHKYNRYPTMHAAGLYNFDTNYTRGPVDNSPGYYGQGFAAFLLGQPTGGQIDRNASLADQGFYHGIFIQDDWKLSRRFTLNIGLRYDYETGATERYNRNILTFDPNQTSPIGAPAQANYAKNPIPEVPVSQFKVQGGLSFLEDNNPRMWESDKNNIQPRVGFAFQVDDKSVVRGGWGIYTVPFFNYIDSAYNQAGFSQSTNVVPSLDNGLTFLANLANPFPSGVADPPGSSLGAATFLGRGLDPTIPAGVRKNEQHMRWSIGFQRELPGQWVFEATYVGNRGYDLPTYWADGTSLRQWELNVVPRQYLSTSPTRDTATINFLTQQVPNPMAGLLPGTGINGATVARSQLLYAYPQYTSIRTERRDGTSSYHSGQFRLEKRFTGSYSLLLGYTFSRYTYSQVYLNPTDAGPTEYRHTEDVPHRFLASFLWELPFGAKKKWNLGGVGNAILGGWSVNGIFNAQTGRPLEFGNLYYSGDPTKLKADYSNVDNTLDKTGFYFSDAAVQTNGVVDPAKQRADQRIRLSSNVRYFPYIPGVRRTGYYFLDMSAVKNIQIKERVTLQLRFEAINALNHPIFDVMERDPTSADFGKVTSQYNIPRNIQLAAKLIF